MSDFRKLLVTSVLALAAATSASQAASILTYASTSGEFLLGPNKKTVKLALNDSGDRTIRFKTKNDNTTVKVTYNATCVASSSVSLEIGLDILVDDEEGVPTGAPTFCGSSDSNRMQVGATRQAMFVVPKAGNHIVRVNAVPREISGTISWGIGQSLLTVED